jgi:aminoglycoside N3'-acetyltransferase
MSLYLHLREVASRSLTARQRRFVKNAVSRVRMEVVRRFRAYDAAQLFAALRGLGLEDGDAVLVHSRVSVQSGFDGRPADLIACLRAAIGNQGTLLMVSNPYSTSTLEYLSGHPRFDVRRTASQMGMLTEVFRRQQGVERSLSPTHPVLAQGSLAGWFLKDHERSRIGCGDDTPFSRLAEVDAKMLFFDTGVDAMTFLHHIEHSVRDELPFPLYDDRVFHVPVVDAAGRELDVAVCGFSEEASRRRRIGVPERALLHHAETRRCRVGNSELVLIRASVALRAGREFFRKGMLFRM